MRKDIWDELMSIFRKNNGELSTESVVEYAKDPSTALYSRFLQDKDKALDLYQKQQARKLIQEFHVKLYEGRLIGRGLLNKDDPKGTILTRAIAYLPSKRRYVLIEKLMCDKTYMAEYLERRQRSLEDEANKYVLFSDALGIDMTPLLTFVGNLRQAAKEVRDMSPEMFASLVECNESWKEETNE